VRRETEVPRQNWQRRCEEAGFSYHSMGGTYWDESACYVFHSDQVDRLESVTAELHAMCLQAASEVVGSRRFDEFAIPPAFHELVAESLRNEEPTLYGRFDLSLACVKESEEDFGNVDLPRDPWTKCYLRRKAPGVVES
jgi:glutathionylspermidine synthase